MIPSTVNRVARHTPRKVNSEIRKKMEANVARAVLGRKKDVEERLQELEREWDIERALETNGSVLLLFGVALGAFVSKKFLVLPALVGAFCLQHAIQGWCPPLEVFRRRGVRTAREIEEERMALKSIRGDFSGIARNSSGRHRVHSSIRAARR